MVLSTGPLLFVASDHRTWYNPTLAPKEASMPKLNIYLPETLYHAVKSSEIPVSKICQQALEAELMRASALAAADKPIEIIVERLRTHVREDDRGRYARGAELGVKWATETATMDEMEQVKGWTQHPWRQLPLHPDTHSLPLVYCRELELPDPMPGEPFWFERSPFVMGLVDSIARMHDQVSVIL